MLQNSQAAHDRFVAELVGTKLQRRVYFEMQYSEKICLSVQNNSVYYAVMKIGQLSFRGQPFIRGGMQLFDYGGYFDKAQENSFENKYSERVSGLQPGQGIEDCSFIKDPKAGELGRYFDSIGGFSISDWDVDLDVQFGTFVDTDKAITIVSNDVIFADDLTAAMTDASAAYRSEQNPVVGSDISVPPTDPTEAATEPATVDGAPAADELAASDAEATGALAEQDAPTVTDSAADEVLDLDRVLGREVQAALNTAGFAVGQPDGLIGARSRKAIADWQASHGHSATGALTRGQAADLLGHAVP
jgi:hypothetical protein